METIPSLETVSLFVSKNATLVAQVSLIAFFGFFAIHLFRKLFTRILLLSPVDNALVGFLATVVDILLKLALLIGCLQKLHVPLTALIAILSAVGIALGLAIQDAIANTFNGLVMIGTKPFKIGDYVKIGDDDGKIEEIRLMNTVLTTLDNRTVILPNKQVFNSRIINYDQKEYRRLDTLFSIDYDNDVEEAKKVIKQTLLRSPHVCRQPEPVIRLQWAGESSLDIALLCWVRHDDYWEASYEVQEKVYQAFLDNHITVPYPQMTLSYRKGQAPRRTTRKEEA